MVIFSEISENECVKQSESAPTWKRQFVVCSIAWPDQP